MGIKPVDYNPFATQYGQPDQYTSPSPYMRRPQAPAREVVAPGYMEPGRQEPWDPSQLPDYARQEADPGVRTARGMINRGNKAEADKVFQELRQRFINNPQALSMLKFLQAQQGYEQQRTKALQSMVTPEQQQTIPQWPQSYQPPNQLQQQGPREQIPRQQQYQSMRPRPGMVVNGYRLVNPAKPNDPTSWQAIGGK